MRPLFVVLILLAFTGIQAQDVKVATWSDGAADSTKVESYAFWIKSGKRAYIRYLHGSESDDVELRWVGPGTENGKRGFWAAFPAPDKRTIFITPADDSTLLIKAGARSKKYYWVNENAGPQSDCDICAESAAEATGWLRRFFWN